MELESPVSWNIGEFLRLRFFSISWSRKVTSWTIIGFLKHKEFVQSFRFQKHKNFCFLKYKDFFWCFRFLKYKKFQFLEMQEKLFIWKNIRNFLILQLESLISRNKSKFLILELQSSIPWNIRNLFGVDFLKTFFELRLKSALGR